MANKKIICLIGLIFILFSTFSVDAIGQENTQVISNVTGMTTDSVDLIRFTGNTMPLFTKVNYWENTGNVHVLFE